MQREVNSPLSLTADGAPAGDGQPARRARSRRPSGTLPAPSWGGTRSPPARLTPLAARQGFNGAMHRDLNQVQETFVGLAKAMPDFGYGWRSGEGVRSVGESFLHVAADRHVIPVPMGSPAPASTGITADDQTAVAFETRTGLTKDEIVTELEASFAHLHEAINTNTATSGKASTSSAGRYLARTRWWSR